MLLKHNLVLLRSAIVVGCFFTLSCIRGSISTVYNLRIAETSKHLDVASRLPQPSLATGTLFGTFREKYNGTKHYCGGGLFTYVYSPESFFLRVDAAVGRVILHDQGVRFRRTQTDDLLFSAGYSPTLSDKMRITFSGLLGLPTHNDTSLEFVQFGYGHYGLGAQIDGSFMYSSSKDHTLRGAARLIHFFPRMVPVQTTSSERFKYDLGNLADLFIAFHSKIKQHRVEVGYNASIFFGAHITPNFDDVVKKTNYIRHSFFGMYKYYFLINKTTSTVAMALSGGFEPTPKVYGNKRLITVWASWGVNF
jgi:hypothetical protein